MSETLTRCLFFAVILQLLALNDESSADPIAMTVRGLGNGNKLTDFETKLIVTYENPLVKKTMASLENDFKVMLTDPNSVGGLRCLSSNIRYVINSKVGGDNVIEIAKAIGFILRDETFDKSLTELITVADQIIDIPDSHRYIRFLFRVADRLLTRPNINQFFTALSHEINKFANEVDSKDVHYAFNNKSSFLRKNWKLLIARNRKRDKTNVETRSLDWSGMAEHAHDREQADVGDGVSENTAINEHGQQFYQYFFGGKLQGWLNKGSDGLVQTVPGYDATIHQTDDKEAVENSVTRNDGEEVVEDLTARNEQRERVTEEATVHDDSVQSGLASAVEDNDVGDFKDADIQSDGEIVEQDSTVGSDRGEDAEDLAAKDDDEDEY